MEQLNQDIKDKFAKLYQLANKGATDGERAAAKNAIDRLISKYKIKPEDLNTIHLNEYVFKYSTALELDLLCRIFIMFTESGITNVYQTNYYKGKAVKAVIAMQTYLDWVTVESAYEYFRRHMKKEWQRVCLPEIKKCRKLKTKTARRKELEAIFFSRYVMESGLYQPKELKTTDLTKLTPKQREDRYKMAAVEGGNYKKQVQQGLFLE